MSNRTEKTGNPVAPVVSMGQAAEILGLHRATCWDRSVRGAWPAPVAFVGRAGLYPRSDIEKMAQQREGIA